MADRSSLTAGLDGLLAPRSIALLGASSDPRKFGGRPLAALRRFGYDGELYVVNPHHADVQGVPCIASPRDLPEGIDLAVVLLPAEEVLPALEVCAERRVKNAAVFSGGFRESGTVGGERQEALSRLATTTGMRILGPNCPGFANLRAGVVCSASAYATRGQLASGRLAFIVQSGAVAGIVCDRAFDRGIGVSYAVCTGNEADVSTAELVRYVARDEEVKAIGLFLEGLGQGDELVSALREARSAKTALVALKVGRTSLGREIVASHTAAIVGANEAFDALCASLGILRVEDYEELLEVTALAASKAWSGTRIAVVGASGGMNTVMADAASEAGLTLATLNSRTTAAVAELTPDFGSATNPVDISSLLLVDPNRLGLALDPLAADPEVDGLVVVIGDHPPALSRNLAATITEAAARTDKPLVVQWSAGSLSEDGIAVVAQAGLPVFREPTRCMRALAQIVQSASAPMAELEVNRDDPGQEAFSENEAKRLLKRRGVPVPRGQVFSRPSDVRVGEELGSELVVKANIVGGAHKTDLGAIRLGVRPGDARDAAAEVLDAAQAALGAARVDGILVEEQIAPTAEVIVSAFWDPHVGTIVAVGSGGELVELVGDLSLRLAPVTEQEAEVMVGELHAAALLDGFRGRPPGDRAALAQAIASVSALAASWGPALGLIELNPVAVLSDGVRVLDAVIEVRG